MDPTIALVVGILLGAIVILVAFFAMARRRSGELRARFGPEYDRALEGRGDRRAAERELMARERRVNSLKLRPLSENERLTYTSRWDAVQRRFLDDPIGAADEAHILLEEVMRQRGYPTATFAEEVELLSVHHPRSVQHYRAAHALAEGRDLRNGEDNGAVTEESRQAVIHYRVLFEDLLGAEVGREIPVERDMSGDETRDGIRDTRPGVGRTEARP